MAKKSPEETAKLIEGLFKDFLERLKEQDSKIADLYKMVKSDQAALKEHQRVLELLFRKPGDNKKIN